MSTRIIAVESAQRAGRQVRSIQLNPLSTVQPQRDSPTQSLKEHVRATRRQPDPA